MALRRLLNSATSISTLLPKPRSISTANDPSTKYLIMKGGRGKFGDDISDDRKRAGVTVRETEEALYLQKAMPGLGREDVKVSIDVDKNTLSIKALSGLRPYQTFLKLPPLCKLSSAKAVMNNGLLRVVVPKNTTDSPPGEEEGENDDHAVGWVKRRDAEDDCGMWVG